MELLGDLVAWFGEPGRWSFTSGGGIPYRVVEHVWVSVVATALAVVLALPPALWLAHRRKGAVLASSVVNIGRAIPSFGLIVVFFMLATRISWVGTSFWPLVMALVALALPPIFTNAYTAVRTVDPATVEAARGMGFDERRVLREVEVPLALPVVLAGIRIAFVQVIATVSIGAIVTNGGGLGRPIVDGFAKGVGGRPEVLAGALLLALLTLGMEWLFTRFERLVIPAGVGRLASAADVAEHTGAAA